MNEETEEEINTIITQNLLAKKGIKYKKLGEYAGAGGGADADAGKDTGAAGGADTSPEKGGGDGGDGDGN